MKLKITEEAIQAGKHDSWDDCPIAIAANKRWPGHQIQVFTSHITVNGRNFQHTRDTRNFIDEWDEMVLDPEIDEPDSPPLPCDVEFPNISSALKKEPRNVALSRRREARRKRVVRTA